MINGSKDDQLNQLYNDLDTIIKDNVDESIDNFEDIDLKVDLLRGIYNHGFEKPSNIQQKAIIPIIKGRDVFAHAQSGTGKTASFAIGSLQINDSSVNFVQTLVLTPTRELALAISKVFQSIGEYSKTKVHAFSGGTNIKQDIKNMNEGVTVVVGTPGRVQDMISKNLLKLMHLKNFVLDETDEMLSRGFVENLKKIFTYIPKTCQVSLYTGSINKDILELSKLILKNPAKILTQNEAITLEGVKQFYVPLKDEWKIEVLLNLYKMMEISQAMIYCNDKKSLDNLATVLTKEGFSLSKITDEMQEQDKDKVMRDFRSGNTRVLLSIDLIPRGKDVHQADLIINFDLPLQIELYKQRIGRIGKFAGTITAINFITPEHKNYLIDLQNFYGIEISELPTELSQIK